MRFTPRRADGDPLRLDRAVRMRLHRAIPSGRRRAAHRRLDRRLRRHRRADRGGPGRGDLDHRQPLAGSALLRSRRRRAARAVPRRHHHRERRRVRRLRRDPARRRRQRRGGGAHRRRCGAGHRSSSWRRTNTFGTTSPPWRSSPPASRNRSPAADPEGAADYAAGASVFTEGLTVLIDQQSALAARVEGQSRRGDRAGAAVSARGRRARRTAPRPRSAAPSRRERMFRPAALAQTTRTRGVECGAAARLQRPDDRSRDRARAARGCRIRRADRLVQRDAAQPRENYLDWMGANLDALDSALQ